MALLIRILEFIGSKQVHGMVIPLFVEFQIVPHIITDHIVIGDIKKSSIGKNNIFIGIRKIGISVEKAISAIDGLVLICPIGFRKVGILRDHMLPFGIIITIHSGC
ncbi:hypothetical protein D3C72_1331990 [compost metagenome]